MKKRISIIMIVILTVITMGRGEYVFSSELYNENNIIQCSPKENVKSKNQDVI